MQDLPRHLGQHSGGMVICQGRLDEVVPLENAAMPGRVVIQWDKDDCADMGIVKVDLLGLGMMAVLQDAIEIVNGRRGQSGTRGSRTRIRIPRSVATSGRRPDLDLECSARPSSTSPTSRRTIRPSTACCRRPTPSASSRSSRARRWRRCRGCKPTNFYDIVVEVAIIRPGPIVGQMVHPYLNRRAGREPVAYPHPSLEPILERTLGVPLFQEQLLRMAMVAAGFTGGQAEELRRAMGFKRSEKRMQQIEGQLREGMARQGITGEAAEQIITSITSFALYGFPESHAASFALLAYASAYLKAHYPAAFYTALLNNQPMGFYHPSTLVKDAQRRGVRFRRSTCRCRTGSARSKPDGAIRLGLRYVSGLREEVGEGDRGRAALDASRGPEARRIVRCPKCGCDDPSMIETRECAGLATSAPVCSTAGGPRPSAHVVKPGNCFCNDCVARLASLQSARRFRRSTSSSRAPGCAATRWSTLADIGALNAFGYDRRARALAGRRAVRPAGELFDGHRRRSREEDTERLTGLTRTRRPSRPRSLPRTTPPIVCPLADDRVERLVADYAGTGLTMGRHPMALRRHELAMRGVLRAIDCRAARQGRRVRVAGMVITRQRPGTAKGFVFLTLEDETGIANIIVRPDLFAGRARHRSSTSRSCSWKACCRTRTASPR